MKEISLETKVAELLNDYEGMKDILIDINPKFKKLNNPVLRRTLAKIASIKQAAIVGGMPPEKLLNQLRIAVGQDAVETKNLDEELSIPQKIPVWIEETPKAILDADALLEAQANPLSKANRLLRTLNDGEILMITSDFQPEPLIVEFEKAGHTVFCHEISKEQFATYIKK